MPSRRRAIEKVTRRPILWLGGSGLPHGPTGRELLALGHPLHWGPASPKSVDTLTKLRPVLVVVQSKKLTTSVKRLLLSLEEHKRPLGFAVFLLQPPRSPEPDVPVDGRLVAGRGVVFQIKAVLDVLSVSDRLMEERDRSRQRLRQAQGETRRLRKLVVQDDLTCLYNLRFFRSALETEHQRAIRFGRHYSLIFIDLDDLKAINSKHGHMAGGQVLKDIGVFLDNDLRGTDVPCRIGGDEFVVICPETTKSHARILAERIRQGIQAVRIKADPSRSITASLGVASFPGDGDQPDQVLERADRALFQAKSQGRNCVVSWGDFSDDESPESPRGSVHAGNGNSSSPLH
ncbi:MAG: GGDEF domain-containing protein [Acidobacteriota bacterium]